MFLMKTEQFFVIRTPDLKQEGIICYWINTHFLDSFKSYIEWEPMNIDIGDLIQNKTLIWRSFCNC